MQKLSQADCLALWESGRGLHPLDQGLLAIQAAFSESRREEVADWPIGRRNHALAKLRCANFGRWLRGWSACAQCSEKLEFALDGNGLLTAGTESVAERIAFSQREFRLPTSRDLAEIADQRDPSRAALQLVNLCLIDNSAELEGGARISWTEEEVQSIGERMAHADPLAEIRLHFDCPTCSFAFDENLDLAAFLWKEMEARAKRLMLDVHELASAYGWSEAEILSLSAARRNFYLEMVRA
jgi:hypothetical protein